MKVAWMVAGDGVEKKVEVPEYDPSEYPEPRLEVRESEPEPDGLTELEKAVVFGG